MREGDVAPPFTLPTQKGRLVSLASLLGRGVVRLVLDGRVRQAAVRLQALAEAARGDAIPDGTTLVVVLHDRVDRVKRYVEDTGLPFDVLVDEEGSVLQEYGCPRPWWPWARGHSLVVEIAADGRITRIGRRP